MSKRNDEQPEEKLTDDVAPHSAPVTVDEITELKQELQHVREEHEQIREEHEVVRNQLKRAVADYQNLEKRVQESRGELAAWASAEIVKKVLPVMDHFDKALSSASEEEAKTGWFKGVKMSVQQLQQVLKGEGLEQIETDGQFDPSLHEAVGTREGKEGQILEVVEKGWRLNGKIVKPARVVVGKKG